MTWISIRLLTPHKHILDTPFPCRSGVPLTALGCGLVVSSMDCKPARLASDLSSESCVTLARSPPLFVPVSSCEPERLAPTVAANQQKQRMLIQAT